MGRQRTVGVRAGGPRDAVCGVVPARTARPRDTEELAGLLAEADRRGWSVAARGGGTGLDWGGRPPAVDLLVDTRGLVRIDHDAGDLVAEVGAGTPVSELTAVLAAAGQRLSADPVRAGGTVGGMLATGLSGPRRLLTGALRDLVIGMTVVRPDGVAARSGGRVVKNVAGYNLAKLHVGGYGALGVIASAAFRLHPLPPALRLVELPLPSLAHAERRLALLRAGGAVPAAVELDWPARGRSRLRVVLEGTPAGVDARAAEVVASLGGGLPAEEVRVSGELPPDWGLLPAGGTLVRLSVPPADAPAAAALAAELGGAAGTGARTTGSARAGALVTAFPPGAGAGAVSAVLEGLRSRPGWSATVLRAEPHLHDAGIDLWGEVPGLEMMRAVKRAMDPGRRMAPGRFVTDTPHTRREERP